jgi:aminocarboxymuconate-semialdehyde decarboxylase
VLVDAHAHLLPRDYPAGAPECFPRMEPVEGSTDRNLIFGPRPFRARAVFFEAERRIEAQDASGVDAEIISPMPPLLRYDLPAADALSLARYVNEFTAGLCAADPARLVGLGMVPLADPQASAAELASVAGLGLRGVEIASNVLGDPIGDEKFLPFFAEAERLGMAVFVHAMPTGESKLPMAARGTYMVGLEGASAAASLVTGGTAAKCPDLRICFSHGAGGYPLALPRAQYFWGGSWNEEPTVPERAIMHDDGPSPFDYARRFYYDSLVFDRRAVRFLVDLLGAGRLVVGSDFPAMPREEPAGRTLRSLGLPPDQLEDITWNNAFRWLGISPVR